MNPAITSHWHSKGYVLLNRTVIAALIWPKGRAGRSASNCAASLWFPPPCKEIKTMIFPSSLHLNEISSKLLADCWETFADYFCPLLPVSVKLSPICNPPKEQHKSRIRNIWSRLLFYWRWQTPLQQFIYLFKKTVTTSLLFASLYLWKCVIEQSNKRTHRKLRVVFPPLKAYVLPWREPSEFC